MKLVRFRDHAGNVRLGTPVNANTARPAVDATADKLTFANEVVHISAYLPPVDPPNIFAIGRNYRAHIEETGAAVPEAPLVFIKVTSAVIPHGGTIRLPASAPNNVDFEAELAVVIGRQARNVSPAEALSYVRGYTCANDVSARDCQRNDKQWARAKGFDTFAPLGPYLVTADEIDPANVGVRSRLNGETMQDSNTRHMMHSCAELISYLSHQFTLLPNTVILTGTPEGVGFARTPPVYLKPGDRIEVEVAGIGTLVNDVRGPED